MEIFNAIFLGSIGGWEWVVIILVVVLLFGGRKIPELMRGLGEGIKEFKNAKDGKKESSSHNNEPQK
ncbi:MAG: twin-arginine translocase TatA/TatE family subunit [Breznakibacter sp.]